MLLIIPDYYRSFQCIADKCKDSCCVGWEIDIDEETYEYYNSVEGEFGKRLKENISVGEDICFVLNGERCPFLNDQNLCDIYTELGDTSLCEVCMEYPRFTLEYGDIREKCLGLSCEAAGALIFESDKPAAFEIMEIPEEFECIEEELEEAASQEEFNESEEELFEFLRKARDYAIYILQYREVPLKNRISIYLLFCNEIQEVLDHDDIEIIEEKIVQFEDLLKWNSYINQLKRWTSKVLHLAFIDRMKVFRKMEVLDDEWRNVSKKLLETFSGKNVKSEEYLDYLQTFDAYYRNREYEYEHLLVYFSFRYLMKSVYDRDFLGKAKLAVSGYLLVRDMDTLRFLEQNKVYTKEDRVDVARIFSKEVEHSEDNLDMLYQEFISESVLKTEELIKQVLS